MIGRKKILGKLHNVPVLLTYRYLQAHYRKYRYFCYLSVSCLTQTRITSTIQAGYRNILLPYLYRLRAQIDLKHTTYPASSVCSYMIN